MCLVQRGTWEEGEKRKRMERRGEGKKEDEERKEEEEGKEQKAIPTPPHCGWEGATTAYAAGCAPTLIIRRLPRSKETELALRPTGLIHH